METTAHRANASTDETRRSMPPPTGRGGHRHSGGEIATSCRAARHAAASKALARLHLAPWHGVRGQADDGLLLAPRP